MSESKIRYSIFVSAQINFRFQNRYIRDNLLKFPCEFGWYIESVIAPTVLLTRIQVALTIFGLWTGHIDRLEKKSENPPLWRGVQYFRSGSCGQASKSTSQVPMFDFTTPNYSSRKAHYIRSLGTATRFSFYLWFFFLKFCCGKRDGSPGKCTPDT